MVCSEVYVLDEAEQLYLNQKLYYKAIKLNIKLFRWDRAIQLVKKFKCHTDTLCGKQITLMPRIPREVLKDDEARGN